ncbi:MAG: hypothetical protein QXY76_07980 [Nitrososphaeria archaeon]
MDADLLKHLDDTIRQMQMENIAREETLANRSNAVENGVRNKHLYNTTL